MEVSFWYQVLITWGKLHESKNARVYHQEDSPRIIGGYWRGHLWEGSPLGLGSLNVGCCPWYDWVISPTVYPFPSPQYRLHPAETQRNSLKIGYLHFRWMILTLPIIKLPFKKGMHCIIMKLVISHDIPRYSPEIPWKIILKYIESYETPKKHFPMASQSPAIQHPGPPGHPRSLLFTSGRPWRATWQR